ncbi:MAG: hypothetical protein HY016_13565 [Nitrosomonadales bacterium]|nr:hypothetical protein [Nitrosomonadales bacterium]
MIIKQKKAAKSAPEINLPNMTQTFFAEVIEATKLNHAEIAEKLDTGKHATLTESKVSQYLTFKATVSRGRLLELSRRTEELGWKIPIAERMLLAEFFRQHAEPPVEKSNSELAKIDKSETRSYKAQIAALEKSIGRLVESELNTEIIIGLVILLTQKLTPRHEWSGGGMVNPAWMNAVLGGDSSGSPIMRWLQWDFMTLDEAEKYLLAQTNDKKDAVKFKPKSTTKPTENSKTSAKPRPKKSPTKRTTSTK